MVFPAGNLSQEKRLLPLLIDTPEEWASHALDDVPALLSDHAHLEKKAAQNALTLLHRRPEGSFVQDIARTWTHELATIAEEEVAHLKLVLGLLADCGGVLSKNHDNAYAAGLRELERRGSDPHDLVDRLLVSALIEARSCERFLLLGNVTGNDALRKLFCGLWSSEHGHYKTFLNLAFSVQPESQVMQRWQELLQGEAQIIQRQLPASRIHSWPPR